MPKKSVDDALTYTEIITMSEHNNCFVCEKTLKEGETLEVKARGLNSLKEASE